MARSLATNSGAPFTTYLDQIDTGVSQRVDETPKRSIVQLFGVQDRASGFKGCDLTEVLEKIKRHFACDSDLVRGLSRLGLDPCSVNAATMLGMRP
jgi:hypothetical protein